jgi:hypothetical protein
MVVESATARIARGIGYWMLPSVDVLGLVMWFLE